MIFVLLFTMFIVIAFIGQMLFIDWRIWLPGAEKSMSMFEGVSASVHTVISQVI
jgi:light-harvesting complex 1 beta chain